MKPLSLRKYPSITSLQCFEATARHKSFTKASKELQMTQSAVSKQVAHLEQLIGKKLFIRTPQYLQITRAGTIYLVEVERILIRIERATLTMLSYNDEISELTILTHPTLNYHWLTPLLVGFDKSHPNIRLSIKDKINQNLVNDETFDIAFLSGNGVWSGIKSIKLFDADFILVCSPSIYDPINNLLDLTSYVFLQLSSRPTLWKEYFAAQKINIPESLTGPKFDTIYACIGAAVSGYGIALAPKKFVQKDLDEGKLICPWKYTFIPTDSYYMAYPTEREEISKVKTLIDWVINRL